MKKVLIVVLLCFLVGAGLVYAGQDPPIVPLGEHPLAVRGEVTVYIEVNQLMTSDTLQWYDVYSTETEEFVGFFTISYTGINDGWELSQLTPHGNTNHFIDNIDYITSFVDNLIAALNGKNKVYLPIVTR